MPGPVVRGVRHTASINQKLTEQTDSGTHLSLMSEGSIRLLLLTSGDLLMARLRNTTDRDGDPAYQLIRPRRVCLADPGQPLPWRLEPFLEGLTPQRNVVLFKVNPGFCAGAGFSPRSDLCGDDGSGMSSRGDPSRAVEAGVSGVHRKFRGRSTGSCLSSTKRSRKTASKKPRHLAGA